MRFVTFATMRGAVGGGVDYLLKVMTRDIDAYGGLVKTHLIT